MTMSPATTTDDDDIRFMRRALALARRGRHTHPNPRVGAVIVREGKIVGEGWHKGVGTPHAETDALANTPGDAARGATIYVTLEPCSFTGGGRTPCSRRCIDAGIARVVGAMTDPDPRVSGNGYAQLRAAGISVTVGVEESAARALNAPYIRHRETGLPTITHKTAMTLDGKIASDSGASKWITGDAARAWTHRHLRNRVDAIVVGIGTVLADDPSLTTRLPSGNAHDPLRVVIDSRLQTPVSAKVARPGTLIAVRGDADPDRRAALAATGAEVVAFPESGRGIDLDALVRHLADARGAYDILLEGGGGIAAAFYAAGLVDKVIYMIAPKILGGRDAKTPVEGAGGLAATPTDAVRVQNLRVRRFGPDLALEGEIEKICSPESSKR